MTYIQWVILKAVVLVVLAFVYGFLREWYGWNHRKPPNDPQE